MNVAPQIDAPTRHLYLLKEKEAQYDAGERRPTPGESAGGERHVRIPYAVLTAGLSPQAVVGYAWLQQHVGDEGCFPSFETLATEMQCSIRAAKARVAELEARRFLAHRRRGLGLSNVYDLYPAGDAPEPKVRRRNPDVQISARQASEVQKTARPDVQSSVNRSAENCTSRRAGNGTLTIPTLTKPINHNSAPTERAAPGQKPAPSKAVATPGQPSPTVEATPLERERVPRAKRASAAPKPSGDAFGLVGWLLKEQGGIARTEWQKVADAKAADAVIARLGGVEAAREHATARLMEPRRTTLLWAHILEDVLRAAAARQRGVVERRASGPAVSAADGFGAVARRARGEEEDDDQGRDGRVAATTFDGVARPL